LNIPFPRALFSTSLFIFKKFNYKSNGCDYEKYRLGYQYTRFLFLLKKEVLERVL